MEFSPGDVVQLKSGGSPMTVERIIKNEKTQEDLVQCVWLERVGERQECVRESFLPIVLEKYESGFAVASSAAYSPF
jgi:uncharacterized protein YodC (DUF2158 family)